MKLSTATIRRVRTKIWQWYEKNKRVHLPWRLTEDPYAILVSEIMLQQTQVDRVIPKYKAFLNVFPTPEALANAPLSQVLTLWSGLGYNNRAIRLQKTAKAIFTHYQSIVPNSYDVLRSLPGVGDYTARAVLAFAFNLNIAVVDTNIRRILIKECKLEETSTPQELLEVAEQLLPKGKSREWYSALMDYGALYLTAGLSGIVPISKQSTFKDSTRYYRGKILKLLLVEGKRSIASLATFFKKDEDFIKTIAVSMEKDGLIMITMTTQGSFVVLKNNLE